MKMFIASWGGKATASLSWGDNGTFRTPAAGVQFPIKIEAPVRNALLVNENVLHASAPYVVGVASGQDSDSGVSGNDHYAPYPAGIRSGDLLVIAIAPRATAGLTAPAGWTTLNAGRAFVIAKIADSADATVGGVVIPPATNDRNWQYITTAVRGWAGTIASDVSYVTGGSSNNPNSRTISWGTAAETLSLEYFIDTNAGGALTITAPTTHNKNTASVQGTEATSGEFISIAMGSANTIGTSIDPATWTITGTPVTTDLVGVLIRGNVSNGLRVRINFRAVQPPALTNSNTLYAHTVNISAGLTVVAPLLTDGDTLFAHSIRTILKPTALTNSSTLRAHSIRTILKPTLYTNTSTYYAHSVRARITAPLLANSSTLRAHSIRTTIRPVALTNSNTLNAHSVRTRLTAPLLTNSNTLRAHSVRATVKPVNLVNSSTLNAHSIRTILKPGLLSNANTFYAHTLTVAGANKQAPLLVNSQTFYSHKIVTRLTAALLTNSSTLNAHSIRRTLRPTNLVNSQTFFSQSIRTTIRPTSYTNSQTFPAHSIRRIITTALLTNTQQFFGHTVLAGNNVSVPLLVNSNLFGAHTVILGTAPEAAPVGSYGGYVSYRDRKPLDREALRRDALKRVKALYARDFAVPYLPSTSRLYAPTLIIGPAPEEDNFGLSPVEIDEITDILDALEAIEAMEAVNELSGERT